MPLLVRRITPEPPPTPTPPPEPPIPAPVQFIDAQWTSPDGEELELMAPSNSDGVHLLAGADGLGAAPRSVATRPLATGGSMARWSHAEERLITLPMQIQAMTHGAFVELRRKVVRAFLATTPAAGDPRPGTLRITRADGTWREIKAIYLDGLSWSDDTVFGPNLDRAVVQLVAPDPWWYGDTVPALEFGTGEARDYFDPYETVSADRELGAATVEILGDVAASPVWTITGPATSVTVRYAEAGPGWTFGQILPGETITIDVERYAVYDNTGANRIGNIAWTTSTLFTLRPGPNDLLLSITGGVTGQSKITLTYRPRYETA